MDLLPDYRAALDAGSGFCYTCDVAGPSRVSAGRSPMEPSNAITPGQLVGRWRHIDGPLVLDWIYRGDGAFAGTVTKAGKHISVCAGTWWLEARTLISVYESDCSGYVEVGYKDRDRILNLQADYFLVQTTGGPKRRFIRVS